MSHIPGSDAIRQVFLSQYFTHLFLGRVDLHAIQTLMRSLMKTSVGPVQTGPDLPSSSGPVIGINQDQRVSSCLQNLTSLTIRNTDNDDIKYGPKQNIQYSHQETKASLVLVMNG